MRGAQLYQRYDTGERTQTPIADGERVLQVPAVTAESPDAFWTTEHTAFSPCCSVALADNRCNRLSRLQILRQNKYCFQAITVSGDLLYSIR